MAWKLDDNKPVYLQLIEQIKRKILTGEYKAGDKIPSVRDLAMDAAVNPNTMQRALQDLERDGLIFAQRTSGRLVTEDKNMILSLKESFAEELIEDFIKSLSELGFSKKEIISAVNTAVGE
ncbi:MAG: GntR family transcriptional regulator [Oscillospiraceae bacterium]